MLFSGRSFTALRHCPVHRPCLSALSCPASSGSEKSSRCDPPRSVNRTGHPGRLLRRHRPRKSFRHRSQVDPPRSELAVHRNRVWKIRLVAHRCGIRRDSALRHHSICDAGWRQPARSPAKTRRPPGSGTSTRDAIGRLGDRGRLLSFKLTRYTTLRFHVAGVLSEGAFA